MDSTRRRKSTAADEIIALAAAPRRQRRREQGRPTTVRAVRDVIDTIDGTVQSMVSRGRVGSLGDRDPGFLEEAMCWLGPLSDVYFRGEVRDIGRIPARGPVLAVGNHSGGLLTPDTWVFLVGFYRQFGLRRRSYALAHNLVLGAPAVGGVLRKLGTLPAEPESARRALRSGAAVLVYPGGDEDVFRSWRDRNRIQLARRTGFIRLALQERVPIAPVVSVGGHETVMVLGNGRRVARLLGANRFRMKSLPLVIAPPWGVSPGDMLSHIPLPAKITVEVGELIDFHAQFGDLDPRDPEVIWACYHLVERRMQAILDRLAAERRLPILG
ncbi:MAG: lysophospholipid acyltransferase family protein [Candidatus Dormibacteria bacterium]